MEEHTGERLLALEALANNAPVEIGTVSEQTSVAQDADKTRQDATSNRDGVSDADRQNGAERSVSAAQIDGQNGPSNPAHESTEMGAKTGDQNGRVWVPVDGLIDRKDDLISDAKNGDEIDRKPSVQIDDKHDEKTSSDDVSADLEKLKIAAKEAEAEGVALRGELEQLQRSEKTR